MPRRVCFADVTYAPGACVSLVLAEQIAYHFTEHHVSMTRRENAPKTVLDIGLFSLAADLAAGFAGQLRVHPWPVKAVRVAIVAPMM